MAVTKVQHLRAIKRLRPNKRRTYWRGNYALGRPKVGGPRHPWNRTERTAGREFALHRRQLLQIPLLERGGQMDYTLWNWLGTGSEPHLYLVLGDSKPKWDSFKIDYGHGGGMPSEWSAWNVTDEKGNDYGTITVANNNGSWSVTNYVPRTDYTLEGISLPPYKDPQSYQLKCKGIHRPAVAPPIITNDGWSSGQGNNDSKPIVGECFWVQDYGMDEPGRWTAKDGAIYQSTDKLSPSSDNLSSRAYPIRIVTGAPTWTVSGGVGVAFDGLWQIDIKIGSDGRKEPVSKTFCETFYLAERADLTPGPSHYTDGAPSNNPTKVYSREIDSLVTKWHDGGPAINLPNGGGTAWNPSPVYGITMPLWTDVGRAPTADFITFGCLIRGKELWLYAYKPVPQTQWYCTKAISKTGTYDQKHAFVPYIGTWCDEHNKTPGGFKTGYKNFIYLPQDNPKIAGKNPHDNPEVFGPALIDATDVLYVVNYDTSATAKKYVVTEADSRPPNRPPLEIGPSSFVRVSAQQVTGKLPWYVADNPTGRPPKTKAEKLPAIISFDSVGGVNCLTAVAYTVKSSIEMNDMLYVANYHDRKLTGQFVFSPAGGSEVPLEIGPRSFVSVPIKQVGGSLPWYVAWSTKARPADGKVEKLPAVFSFAPLTGVSSLYLTAVAYRAK
jgi:hypothetical protein